MDSSEIGIADKKVDSHVLFTIIRGAVPYHKISDKRTVADLYQTYGTLCDYSLRRLRRQFTVL